MKTFNKTILLLMAIVAISFTSCKKDDDGGDDGGAASGQLSAKVAGSDYTSEVALTTAIRSDVDGTSTLLITANTMNGKNITLSIMGGFEGVGSYNIGGGANIFVSASYGEADASNPTDVEMWVAPYDTSVTGKINVAELSSTTVKGTFNFRGLNADGTYKDITEGSFNVDFK